MSTADPRDSPYGLRAAKASLGLAVASITTSTLPVFLFGAFAIFVRRDLDFSHAQVGITAATFYTTSACASIYGGRMAHRLGPERSMAVGGLMSVLGLVGIAALAQSWVHIAVLLAFAGLGNALSQPAANTIVMRDQPSRRRGTGFGMLQSAIPLATLFAGLVVPLVAASLSWRWGFAGAAVVAAGVAGCAVKLRSGTTTSPRAPSATVIPPHVVRRRPGTSSGLYLLAIAGGLAAAAGNVLGAFYVESIADAGVSISLAGLLLVVGSCCGVTGRLVWGWGADHWIRRPLRFVTGLLVVGTLGFLAIGLVDSVSIKIIATVLAFGAGWAWKGLFNLSVVELNPTAPSVALGVTQAGVFAGSVAGPLGFGFLLDLTSYEVAWSVTALVLAMAAVVLTLHIRRRNQTTGYR